jgi:ABC-type bacteriocin/lantibiotic exporter with double-glycine peptidase domain
MNREPFTRTQFLRFLLCGPLYVTLTLLVCEALLSAATTWLVIKAGRDVANGDFLVVDLFWILIVQSTSYLIGAVSWVFAERAGMRAFGLYMARFARDNRHFPTLLGDRHAREQVEPFLTGETFHTIYKLMYEVEGQLKVLLSLIFNSIVLGAEIDGMLPLAYATVFIVLMTLQYAVRKRVTEIYLDSQRWNNRVTAHGYTFWDNVFAGNRYNLRLWFAGFKYRARECLKAAIRVIVAREGLSATGAIFGLTIIFITLAYIAFRDAGNTAILIGLAATLPRQIEMTNEVHQFAIDWNDVLAAWTRVGGIADNMHPEPDPAFNRRIKFDRLVLREQGEIQTVESVEDAMKLVLATPVGRINVRGGNGSGKSTLLAALKAEIKRRAYYWPTSDRLAFVFTSKQPDPGEDEEIGEDGEVKAEPKTRRVKRKGFSSGERQLRSLEEIVSFTEAPIYLLDEWDANLDAKNRAAANALVEQLAARARVVEISHRDTA